MIWYFPYILDCYLLINVLKLCMTIQYVIIHFQRYMTWFFMLQQHCWKNERFCHRWLSGLGVWFALRVREVPGSNPGWAHRYPFISSFYFFGQTITGFEMKLTVYLFYRDFGISYRVYQKSCEWILGWVMIPATCSDNMVKLIE